MFPDYYTQPFHAYSDGNLCWEAALQVCTLLVKCPSLNCFSATAGSGPEPDLPSQPKVVCELMISLLADAVKAITTSFSYLLSSIQYVFRYGGAIGASFTLMRIYQRQKRTFLAVARSRFVGPLSRSMQRPSRCMRR